jgi:hypothetical protein
MTRTARQSWSQRSSGSTPPRLSQHNMSRSATAQEAGSVGVSEKYRLRAVWDITVGLHSGSSSPIAIASSSQASQRRASSGVRTKNGRSRATVPGSGSGASSTPGGMGSIGSCS